MACLKDMPPEVVGLITPDLVSWEIARLIMCGDKRFNHTLLSPFALPEFTLILTPGRGNFKRFPNLAALFPSLRRLSIKDLGSECYFHELMHYPLSHLPSTLEYLEMSFADCEQWFLTSPSGCPTSSPSRLLAGSQSQLDLTHSRTTSFPNLKTLILKGSASNRLFRWNMPHLAPNLEYLTLGATNGITKRHIKDFPTSLTALRLLSNSTLLPDTFSLLPRSLQLLELSKSVYNPHTHAERATVRPDDLPPSLTEFDCSWYAPDIYPPSLEKTYPSALRRIRIACIGPLESEKLKLLPPNLSRLHFTSDSTVAYGCTISQAPLLPPSLEELLGLVITPQCAIESLSCLPPHLTSLSLCGQTLLPPLDGAILLSHLRVATLQHLVLDLLFAKNLPFLLLHLNESLESLSLQLDLSKIDRKDLFAGSLRFPEQLKRLSITVRRSFHYGPDLPLDATWLVLPLKLTHLTLNAALDCSTQWIQQLPLTLKNLEFRPKNLQFFDFAKCLPRSLKTLVARITSVGDYGIQSASDLPPHLETLTANSIIDANDNFVAALPQSITSLSLPQATYLTQACLAYLPRAIESFTGPPNLTKAWKQMDGRNSAIVI